MHSLASLLAFLPLSLRLPPFLCYKTYQTFIPHPLPPNPELSLPPGRIYKAGEALLTDLQREGNSTLGQAQVQVTPGDNGVEVTCEATNSPTSAPPSASFTLSVLCECSTGGVFLRMETGRFFMNGKGGKRRRVGEQKDNRQKGKEWV